MINRPSFPFALIMPRTLESRMEIGPEITRTSLSSCLPRAACNSGGGSWRESTLTRGSSFSSKSPTTTTPARSTPFPSFSAARSSSARTAYASRSASLHPVSRWRVKGTCASGVVGSTTHPAGEAVPRGEVAAVTSTQVVSPNRPRKRRWVDNPMSAPYTEWPS